MIAHAQCCHIKKVESKQTNGQPARQCNLQKVPVYLKKSLKMSENIWLTRLCAHGYIFVDDDGMVVMMGLFNIILGSGLVWCGKEI